MAADDHIEIPRWQFSRHFNVARRVRTVVAVVIMSHMGGGNNHIRLFVLFDLLDQRFGLHGGIAELNTFQQFRITNFGRIVGG